MQPVDDQALHDDSAVGRALQFINEQSAEPITGPDIAAAAGRSARGLQQAFAKANLPAPMVALRQARLRAVRALQDAEPGSVIIAQIATAAGLGHMGRFSSYYHHEYAELPSTTLNIRRKATHSPGSSTPKRTRTLLQSCQHRDQNSAHYLQRTGLCNNKF